jgi:hypothetical protein
MEKTKMEKTKMENIEIIRSDRRKRTIQAREIDGKLYVYLPGGMSKEEEKRWINEMIKKMEKQKRRRELNSKGSLPDRAQALNERYFDGKLKFDIKYVTNQNSKFGSCTPANKMIRISDRLADVPGWVRDYVIVHELAHLVHPDHSRRFWDLVNHYRYTERARGYLMAIGMNDDEKIK